MFNNIKYFIQRGKRGYSNQDLWNVDSYLCEIIPPMVRHLKDTQTGCPSEFFDASKVNDECWKWKAVLEEIAQGFEAAQEIGNTHCSYRKNNDNGSFSYEFDEERAKQLRAKFERGIELLKETFFGLWD